MFKTNEKLIEEFKSTTAANENVNNSFLGTSNALAKTQKTFNEKKKQKKT